MSWPAVPSSLRVFNHSVQIALVHGLLWGLHRLSYGRRLKFGGRIFSRVIALLTSHHKRIVENLELIFSDMPAGNAERSSQDVSRNIGITFTESYSLDDFLNATAHPSLHGAGFEVLK